MPQTFYVNPTSGNDSADGSQGAPLKTIAAALRKTQAGDRVQLAAGTYSSTSGEEFPLTVPSGVTVVGNEGTKGSGILVRGSGRYVSPTFAGQNVLFLLTDDAHLRGVTATNPETRGTAAWVESARPTIANNTFVNSNREGVFVSGSSVPLVEGNLFETNSGNGLSIDRNSSGTIRGNTFRNTGFGIAVGGNASPTISGNVITGNRSGVVASQTARPILRNNTIENNRDDGLTVINQALPDLGSAGQPGNNVFRANGKYDIQNATTNTIMAVGNQIGTVLGAVSSSGSVSPSPTPVPIPSPDPTPTPTPTPIPVPTPIDDLKGHWAEAFIRALISQGVVKGFEDGSFRPNNKLTRAEYAALVVKAFDRPLVKPPIGFSDVPAGFWAIGAIAKASQMGFISGFPDNSFRPGQNLTRTQALLSITNGLGLSGGSLNLLGNFADRAQIPSYATNPIATATANRLVVNYPQLNALRPLEDITRAEVAALIYQARVLLNQAPALTSPYIVQPDTKLPAFTDTRNHWAEPFIEALANRGLIGGFPDGSFRPDATMTRAQFASAIAKVFNPPAERPGKTFTDVSSSFWGNAAIQQAYRAGFMSGTSETTFSPDATLQKVQIAVALASGLDWPDGTEADLASLSDREAVAKWARPKVAAVLKRKALVSYPSANTFAPERFATRAEVAAMLYQALRDRDGSLTAINSPYVLSA
ncbi:MAG: S-layer homology domain-containing protein [Limnothrix sp. BL-A-16]